MRVETNCILPSFSLCLENVWDFEISLFFVGHFFSNFEKVTDFCGISYKACH